MMGRTHTTRKPILLLRLSGSLLLRYEPRALSWLRKTEQSGRASRRGSERREQNTQSAELEDEGTNAHNTKAETVVTIIGIEVAAIRATSDVSGVVPRTTTQHPRS